MAQRNKSNAKDFLFDNYGLSDYLKSKSTTPYSPKKIDGSDLIYNSDKLSKYSNLSNEILASIADDKYGEGDDIDKQDDQDDEATAKNKREIESAKKDKKPKKEFILSMVLKMVPIGVNIAKRGKTLAIGFKELGIGIANMIKNSALLLTLIGIDSIIFFVQLFIFLFKLLFCSITIIMRVPKCVVFYYVHAYIIYILILTGSVCFLFDIFLMVKYFTGSSFLEMFLFSLQIAEIADQFTYSNFNFHIIHYSDSINEYCYDCSTMGDTSGFKAVASRMFNYFFVSIPLDVGGPLGEALTGLGHIFGFFAPF